MKKRLFFFIFAIFFTTPLFAQQEGFLGEVKMFAGNFAPRSWAFCDGQLLAISSNSALFSILGTTYGGDGRTTFALPDLRSRVPVGPRQGPGLSDYRLGQRGGQESVTLNVNQIPAHSHATQVRADTSVAITDRPEGGFLARNAAATPQYGDDPNTTLDNASINVNNTGGNQPHTNVQPFLSINYIICIQGTFPSRP